VNGEELEITPKGQDKPTEKSFKEPGSSIYEQGIKARQSRVGKQTSVRYGNFWVVVLGNVLPVVIIAAILF
jgi:hypothetical protein